MTKQILKGMALGIILIPAAILIALAIAPL